MLKPIFWVLALFPLCSVAQYNGTGSVTKGKGQITIPSLMNCSPGRIPALGTITDNQNKAWVVPAEVEYTNNAFPFASDLYNSCLGKTYPNAAAALKALDGSDIVQIDEGGELVTAYVFADNYFEMYINGKPVGKDKVPFTEFNSCIVRFRVKRPFTISMLLVDWEEALGLGTELNGGFAYHPGDGGMVALFTDSIGSTIAITSENWKAQTFYTAPIKDLTCAVESGHYRYSTQCNTVSENDGSNWYGLHWKRPDNWMQVTFSDTAWPNAFVYTNTEIGVNNKPSYTNFTDIFDKPGNDAKFIWSSNVILDNEVLVRYTVPANSASLHMQKSQCSFNNPAAGMLTINKSSASYAICTIYSQTGQKLQVERIEGTRANLDISALRSGCYVLEMIDENNLVSRSKLIITNP